MHRITIRLNEEDFKKIQRYASRKKNLFLSEYMRSLIQTGLQVEEATEKTQSTMDAHTITSPDSTKVLDEHQHLWKNMLIWGLESRYLIRYIVDKLPKETAEQHKNYMDKAKKKAELRIAELLNATSGLDIMTD